MTAAPEEEKEDGSLWAAVAILLLLLGGLVLFVLTGVLLGQTWAARDACGSLLWWLLIARLVLSAWMVLCQCFVWCDLEPGLRERLDLAPLEDEEAGGLGVLCLGGGDQAERLMGVGLWVVHCFFVITLSVALAQFAAQDDACTAALAASSFSHNATGLHGVAWAWLALDVVAFVGSSLQLLFGPRFATAA